MIFTFVATGCGDVRGVEIDYGTSEIYTENDMKDALPCIFTHFIELNSKGSKLKTLSYVGDKACEEQLNEWKNSNKKRLTKYDQCMIFYSKAIVDIWDEAGDYTLEEREFTYVLGKTSDDWKIVYTYMENYY